MKGKYKISSSTRRKIHDLFMEVLTEYGGGGKEVNEFAARELVKGAVKESLRQSRLMGVNPEVICLSMIALIRSGQVEKAMDFAKEESPKVH